MENENKIGRPGKAVYWFDKKATPESSPMGSASSVAQAAEMLNGSASTISWACQPLHRQNTYKGYYFQNSPEFIPRPRHKRMNIVSIVNTITGETHEEITLAEAGKIIGCHFTTVQTASEKGHSVFYQWKVTKA